MSSLNKVMLIGRLGKDPEVRFTADGTPVANFSLATSEFYMDKSGTRQERTEWHNIVAWRRLADLSKNYLAKGRQVYIEGRITSREWTDKEGGKRRTTEIVANQMVLLGSRGDNAPAESLSAGAHSRGPSEPEAGPTDFGITDDDIPF